MRGVPGAYDRPMSTGETPAGPHPPGWYADPWGRHEHRWWDGHRWTAAVADGGRRGEDPPQGTPTVPTVNRPADRIRRDVQRAGADTAPAGGGTLFTEPVLVVNQKAKLIEVTNTYAVFDRNGNQIGAVRQVGQSTLKKVARVLTSYDQFFTHTLQVVDAAGTPVLSLTRPRKLLKSRVLVDDAAGNRVGEIIQRNAIGKIRFGLVAGGTEVGEIRAENWRAWNFTITDAAGTEVARITKTWEGLAKTLFTTADNYVVQIHRPLTEPLRSLVVAAALAVDTALKQDSRGLS